VLVEEDGVHDQERKSSLSRGFDSGRSDHSDHLVSLTLTQSVSCMASMHYGTPSSLPSDYALLSRYANSRATTNNDDPVDDLYNASEPSDAHDDMIPIRPATRRSSFPSPYLRPLQPKLPEPFASKVAVPDEYTPLLVPRIVEEDASPSTDPACSQSSSKVYRDEFYILCKYSLPVFG
jgi:MATE family multidrug resistance protein